MQKIPIIFLLVLLPGHHAFSQQYPFVHYSPREGLVSNRTRFMIQDSKGLLYISTYGGLSVYDGSRFSNYTTDDGLASNLINDIVEMGDDSVWIVPNSEKLHYLKKGVIRNVITSDGFYPIINKIIHCTDGFYYALADQGLFRFEKNHFVPIKITDLHGRDAGRFFLNGIEANGNLLLVTDPDVKAFPSPSHLVLYNMHTRRALVNDSLQIVCVLQSPRGDVLVSTTQGMKQLDQAALSQNKILLTPPSGVYANTTRLVANFMYFDHQENLWLATSEGTVRINPDGQTKLFSEKNGLEVNVQEAIFQDHENVLWFLNGQTGMTKLANPGLEYYSPIRPGFSIHDIFADKKSDSVWFLDGVHNRLLLQTAGGSKEFRLEKDRLFPPYAFFAAAGNRYYLADLFNIFQCRFLPGGRIKLSVLHIDSTQHSKRGYHSMMPDGQGNLLLCAEEMSVWLQNKKLMVFPLDYFADHFCITADNQLWTATRTGKIMRFRIHPEDPDHYLRLVGVYNKIVEGFDPRSIAIDNKGRVWVGTRDRGLYCLVLRHDSIADWKQFTTKDGLSDNFISYLQADDQNQVWACSPGGLDKIQWSGSNLLIENVTRSNSLYQYINKIQTSRNGVRWAQTSAGVIRIDPNTVHPGEYAPKIIFRGIWEGRNRLDSQSLKPILSYQQNNLSFVLAMPSFLDEKQVRFSYLLTGSGRSTWSDPSPEASINFINLPPGRYNLRARAQFANGMYPESEISYAFVISPPWWQTWWFRLVAVLCVMLILALVLRGYYQRKLRRQQVLLEKQNAVQKERTRIAHDMHDDLGAGLSTIRFLSEKLRRNIFSQVSREDIDKMQSTSNELIDKMNEIIWTMNEKNDSLEDLLLYVRSYAMEYCNDNNLECSIDMPEQVPMHFVSGEMRRNIFLTVKESLHNIVKHACAKNVEIAMEISGSLNIVIHDNGKGFEKGQRSREGNGLRNMQDRIRSVGGTLSIQNEIGTTVRLKIPIV